MRDTELYQTLLGLNAPWEVTAVDVTQASDECPLGEIAVRVRWQPDAPLRCPACGAVAPGYDTRTRRWAAVATGPTAGTATAWMTLVWLSTPIWPLPPSGGSCRSTTSPLTRLMPVGIAPFVPVLGRRRGVDEGGIDHRDLGDLGAPGLPVMVDLLEELLAEMVLLEERAELQDGGLIRHRLLAEIYADEPAHGDRFVQGLLGPGIGEIEPLLEEVIRSICSSPTLAGRSRPWGSTAL